MDYFNIITLGDLNDRSLCILANNLDELGNKSSCLKKGKRLEDLYPKDAKYYMDDGHPGIRLCSLLGNLKSFLIQKVHHLAYLALSYSEQTLPFQ